jgi:hypothetical protein
MDRFVKRIQSRLSDKRISLTKSQCREAYQAVIPKSDWESPSNEQLCQVVEYVKTQTRNDIHQPATVETSTLTVSEPEMLEPIQPQTFEVPVAAPEEIPAIAAITQQPAPSAITPANIPQSEITGLVDQVFASQPPALKEQLTDYAMQHAFGDVRQVQEFLEQLRSMEFELMVQTLQDHMKRRGSMLTLLDNLIATQKHEDQERKDSFFSKSQSSLEAFRLEMSNRLSKQSL